MYRFIDFNDEKADTFLLLELTDLAKTLASSPLFEAAIRVHSYLSMNNHKVYVSHFWNHRPEQDKKAGMKSDIYLRALGNKKFTDFQVIDAFIRKVQSSGLSNFSAQLLMLAEDLRIEELCKKERPGTVSDFNIRRKIYNEYFSSQLVVNLEKNLYPDALFNLIYLILNSGNPFFSIPSFNEEIDRVIPIIRGQLELLFETKSTRDCIDVCTNVIEITASVLSSDMINEYFHLPNPEQNMSVDDTFSDLVRKDPLQNNDTAEEKAGGNEEVHSDKMNTWHRETESPGKSFMQFELEQGTRTDISGGSEREGEEGDQALALIQGRSKQTENRDYSKLEISGQADSKFGQGKNKYGSANKNARAIFLEANRPDQAALSSYSKLENEVKFYHKKLKNIIKRMMEKKETDHRTQLQMGRLGKNLLSYFTDEHPKLFYKKFEPGKEINAAFSLLVDCSASMFDKMDETKRGIVLFHEALKAVSVPHEIIGFWEDANEAVTHNQPNYFFQAIPFSKSLLHRSGPEIMQLEAMEDNRDGYAIRIMAERLLKQSEKQKFLIVFSDGEPAAFDYDNGIVDTHEAVMEVRKMGIEVFNIFLSNSGLEPEQKRVFENIYGNRSIVAPYVDELPEVLFPLLKKLLNQSING
ncbi:von Willebrand factor A [Bacillus freudenreichii]|nr:von Willebrand factor A [Bacillus freudenreichii]